MHCCPHSLLPQLPTVKDHGNKNCPRPSLEELLREFCLSTRNLASFFFFNISRRFWYTVSLGFLAYKICLFSVRIPLYTWSHLTECCSFIDALFFLLLDMASSLHKTHCIHLYHQFCPVFFKTFLQCSARREFYSGLHPCPHLGIFLSTAWERFWKEGLTYQGFTVPSSLVISKPQCVDDYLEILWG